MLMNCTSGYFCGSCSLPNIDKGIIIKASKCFVQVFHGGGSGDALRPVFGHDGGLVYGVAH